MSFHQSGKNGFLHVDQVTSPVSSVSWPKTPKDWNKNEPWAGTEPPIQEATGSILASVGGPYLLHKRLLLRGEMFLSASEKRALNLLALRLEHDLVELGKLMPESLKFHRLSPSSCMQCLYSLLFHSVSYASNSQSVWKLFFCLITFW